MINKVPVRLDPKLATPYKLVRNKKPDSKTWFELFSVGYFSQDLDGYTSRSKTEGHSLDGIAVGRDDKINMIVFYNSLT